MKDKRTINQHYVPQLLLSGFDTVNSKSPSVNIFDVERNVVRQGQSIKEVFSQNYFYDIDNQIEDFLAENIEAPAAEIIRNLRLGNYDDLNNEDTKLIKFMCCQNSRTVEAREDAINFINASFNQIVHALNRHNDLGIDNPEGFKILPSDKDGMRNFNASQALSGVIDSKGMEDLRFHILKNTTKKEFVISDHPIGRYNWLYRDLEDPRVGSILAKGVQLFLPLSTSVCLCAYDSKTYKYGERSSDVYELKFERDVDWLNEIQMRNARSFIAFTSLHMEAYLRTLHKYFHSKNIYSRKSLHLGDESIDSESIKTRYMVHTEQVKLKENPSFFKVLKKARVDSKYFQERNPEVSEALMMLKRSIRDERIANQSL